jgi:hypothetical protein
MSQSIKPDVMEEINLKENLENPVEFERLYRSDKKAFKTEFERIFPEIKENSLAGYWKVRLDYEKIGGYAFKIRKYDIIALLITCLAVGFLANLPVIFNFNMETSFYLERNAGLIFFFGLSLYAIITMRITDAKKLLIFALLFIIPAVYINLLPTCESCKSITLAYIHLPLLMWCIYGLVYIDFDAKSLSKRTDYIKLNGDLAVLGAIIVISGIALTIVTIGLFSAIDISIERIFKETFAFWGFASAAVLTAFIIRNYPSVTNKIAPVIASVFSPLVLIILISYLIAIAISGKNPYNDRDFLLIFNLMLVGVMAIISFSVSESSFAKPLRINGQILFILSIISLLINLIALSAIVYRLNEYGISANKVAVLVSNLLVFVNLILIMFDLYKVIAKGGDIQHVETTISKYLPIYAAWTILVVFAFPVIFGFK